MEASKWMVFSLLDQRFAVPAREVLELVKADGIHPMSAAPADFVGLMRLRDDVFPVLDLRRHFGLKNKEKELDEFCEMLDAREQDHRKWLTELRDSVAEQREFRLTTDPHKCAFGKWYDSYRSDSMAVRLLLMKFDSPHKAIHRLALVVRALVDDGAAGEAMEVIRRAWDGELQTLVKLFGEAKRLIRSQRLDTVLVMSRRSRTLGVLVDEVREIAEIEEEAIFPMEDLGIVTGRKDILGVARVDGSTTILLRLESVA